MSNDIHPGKSYPLGATSYDHGVNFCVFSRNAESMELLLFDPCISDIEYHQDDRRLKRMLEEAQALLSQLLYLFHPEA